MTPIDGVRSISYDPPPGALEMTPLAIEGKRA